MASNPTDKKRDQVAKQCLAVAHMATALAQVYKDYAGIFNAGALNVLVEQVGDRTAHLMETFGDVLNGMDAVDDVEDAWLDPVFKEAQRLWPQQRELRTPLSEAAPDLLGALKDLYRAYVNTLETGRDRIISFGGDCDPVDVMENGDPALRIARAAITAATGPTP